MGYSVLAYLVDLDQLCKVYGSHDLDLVAAIENQFADYVDFANEEIESLNYELTDAGEPTMPTVNQALCDSVVGRIPGEYEYTAYSYALVLFCRYLGTELPHDRFEFLRPYGVKFIEEEVQAMADLIFRSGPPGPIVFPKEFVIGHMGWEQAAEQLAHWQPVIISDDPIDREWEQGVCDQYAEWLKEAIQTRRGIVAFFS